MELYITNQAAIQEVLKTFKKKPKLPVSQIRLFSTKDGIERAMFDFNDPRQQRETEHEAQVSLKFCDNSLEFKYWNLRTHKLATYNFNYNK